MSTRHLFREALIIKMYQQGQSPYEIAEQLPGWNHMRVRRLLKKAGLEMRDKSEAQSEALKSGRSISPKKLPKEPEGSYNIEEEHNTNKDINQNEI